MIGKGRIEVGYDADLALVDLNRDHVIRNGEQETKCGWSPWAGETLVGSCVHTWVMGHEVYREGEFDLNHRGSEVQFDHSRGGYWGTE
jgi:dihydroorotase